MGGELVPLTSHISTDPTIQYNACRNRYKAVPGTTLPSSLRGSGDRPHDIYVGKYMTGYS